MARDWIAQMATVQRTQRDTNLCKGWITRCIAVGCTTVAIFVVALGCRSPTPLAKTGKHQPDEPFVSVTRPPDTVNVQILPPRPDNESVWVDGCWVWEGRRWNWKEGTWERPVPGAHYARPDFVMRPVMDYTESSADHSETDERTRRQFRAELQYRPGRWVEPDAGTREVDARTDSVPTRESPTR